jgi:serine/threonine-protein kinase
VSDQRISSDEPREAVGPMSVRAYGKYLLVKKLAEGGMAEIFLAKQVGLEGFEKNVVIKRMLPHLSGASDFVAMFLDEARLAASLAHPNIVQITDLGLADGCYFICMEHLPGEDLAAALRLARRKELKVPLVVLLRVFAQAAAGLHFAHEAVDSRGKPLKLVHRDVTPSNIFITYSGQVKMLDFGIAKAESRVATTTAGVVKGKYQYMSPEQARGDPVDRRADLFALGVSLYEGLTGVKPFARDNDLAVLRAVLEGQYQPIRALRPDLPLEVEQIVTRAMAQEAEHRYATALEVAEDLKRYLAASASPNGSMAVAAFMLDHFGEERMRARTRVESLDELAARGVFIPGRPSPLPQRPEDATRALPARAGEAPAPSGGVRRTVGLVALVAATAALSVGAVTLLRPAAGPAPAVLPPAEAVQATPLPVPDAALPEAADASALVQAPPVDAGPAAPEARPSPPRLAAPVELTPALVSRTITASKARFQRCFLQHQADLPARTGTLTVRFSIASSGRVTEATSDLEGTSVSGCVVAVVRTIGFPRHVDAEVRVPVALTWDLTQGRGP